MVVSGRWFQGLRPTFPLCGPGLQRVSCKQRDFALGAEFFLPLRDFRPWTLRLPSPLPESSTQQTFWARFKGPDCLSETTFRDVPFFRLPRAYNLKTKLDWHKSARAEEVHLRPDTNASVRRKSQVPRCLRRRPDQQLWSHIAVLIAISWTGSAC